METQKDVIWTIGHSNRTLDGFLAILRSFDIQLVADVRHFPGSRKFPHFNKENLAISLQENDIRYEHLIDLGGRRKQNKESKNIAWRHPAFRSYADYMETEDFKRGINSLKALAHLHTTAFMCSEAVWWSCHRAMISDFLKAEGWRVMHIMAISKADEHPYTSPAQVKDGKLSYG